MTATKQRPRSDAAPSPAAAAGTPGAFGAATPFVCGKGGGGRGEGEPSTPAPAATPVGSRGGSRTPGSKGLGARLEGTPGASQGAARERP
jgi:hypothetical protein